MLPLFNMCFSVDDVPVPCTDNAAELVLRGPLLHGQLGHVRQAGGPQLLFGGYPPCNFADFLLVFV